MTKKQNLLVIPFKSIRNSDVPLVGGKNASLGEMYSKLKRKGLNIPNGFAITSNAYIYLLKYSKADKKIKALLKNLDTSNLKSLQQTGKSIRELILSLEIPKDLEKQILKYYKKLRQEYGKNCDVAVRSSATSEDLPDASFAGQQETYLNIRGEKELLIACKKCFSSLFTDRAISYRHDKKFDHLKIALSIGVQKMVRSDLASSGVMFTLDTESGFRNVVFINSSYGLGENIVKGYVNPDTFYVFKPTLNKFKPIISRSLGNKKKRLVYTKYKKHPTKNVSVSKKYQNKFSLNDDEILTLARWGCIIEQHYNKPMDIEWAKDGITKKLFIVQARPETVHSNIKKNLYYEYELKEKSKVLVTGRSVGQKIGTGEVNVISNVKGIYKFKKGQVLVTEMTDPDWEPILKIASAIVTNRGGSTCHAAIVSRELGIPCIVGTENATKKLKNKSKVTIDCSKGETGYVYSGVLKYDLIKHDIKKLPKTRTKIMVNIGEPEEAFRLSFLPVQGVGLAREEFIAGSYIRIHPNALLNFNKLSSKDKRKILEITKGYKIKDFFVDKMAEGIAKIAAAFYPKPVILRLSDFKTNEYRTLIGGSLFEPNEDNPMMGWRGASRYYDKRFIGAFKMECLAIKRVIKEYGLKNLQIMVPMVRTIKEGKNVLNMLGKNGLKKGKNGLKIYAMCEIPSNIILADEFLKIFDGFSIGSNDLTQFTLATDRDNSMLSHVYDERNPAVKKLIMDAIKACNKRHKYIGICGQAPSDYLDFAKFLVKSKIQSISLNPDSVISTLIKIKKFER
ncbi:MAG: phosphoenolpyruvate synthase [Nanoarchaeota archaeon]